MSIKSVMSVKRPKPLDARAQRMSDVVESATLKLNATVQAMRAKGEQIDNLTAGEPDFMAPDAAKDAVRKALDANASKYTAVAGIPELRERIAQKTNAQQPSVVATGRPWKAADVIVSNGGKQAIFDALLSLVDRGDEVLIVAPYWLSYPEMVKIADGTPVVLPTAFDQGFKLGAEQLARAIRPETRMLILNSPSNPTGATYSRAEYMALGKVLSRPEASHVWILSDEIYDRMVYDGQPFVSFAEACPELRDRVITVNGLSKSGAMTGWRIGWSVAPSAATQVMSTLQGQSTSGINALAQWAAVAALDLPDHEFEAHRKIYEERRDRAYAILSTSQRLRVFRPPGAFYLWVDCAQAAVGEGDGMRFAEALLEQKKVAVVPGEPFGAPSCVRLSFATDLKTLEHACQKIVDLAG